MAVLSYSFFTSLHCAFMCGPLVVARFGGGATLRKPSLWLYNFGRFLGYTSTGALFGALGGWTQNLLPTFSHMGDGLAVGLGVVLAALGVHQLFGGHWTSSKVSKIFGHASLKLQNRFGAWPKPVRELGFGMATALLPCATLTPAFLAAASTQSAPEGALIMGAFALGTGPIMLLAPTVPTAARSLVTARWGRWIGAFFLIFAGILTVMRGL